MPWAIDAALGLTLLVTALSAVVIAAALLSLEFFGNRRMARHAPGLLAVILVLGALLARLSGLHSVALGATGLATVLLVAWPVSFESARQRITRLITPKVAWTVVLGVSLIASRFLAAHVLHTLDRRLPPQSVDLEDLPIRFTEALTDKGRTIGLFHFKIHSTDSEIQQFIDSNEKDRLQIIRLYEPNPAANCHGWVFTRGEFGIRDAEIAAILSDNGYAEVGEPQKGDLAIYVSDHRITHSGVVHLAEKHAPILIESKWGPLGVYLHAIDKQPFPGACKFYRSSRPDHLLVTRPASSAFQPVSQQINDSAGAQ